MFSKNQIQAALLALSLLVSSAPLYAAPAKYTLKFATLAPEGSTWMSEFNQIKEEVTKATEGQVLLKVYPAGILGEEKDVLLKIKLGQIDGGAFGGHGREVICPDSKALMQPLLFRDYDEVDAVFSKMRAYLENQSKQNGFIALGWTEIGFSYLYSTTPVVSIENLRAAKPWLVPNDEALSALFSEGKVSAIPVPVSDVLTALQTGLIDTVFGPPVIAVAMQWFTRVKYRNDLRLLYSFGGLFVSDRSWSKIPEQMREPIMDICRKHLSTLTARSRSDNEDAIKSMVSNGIQTVKSSDAEVQRFAEISKRAIDSLKARKLVSTEAMNLVEQSLVDFRESHGQTPAGR